METTPFVVVEHDVKQVVDENEVTLKVKVKVNPISTD